MDQQMPMWDRTLRGLFVALAVGLGWGIRGDFGHVLGAMYPGAALGLGFAYVSGQKSMFKWMPIVGALAALGISLGGRMSYGILHGYAKSDTLINYAYGFFTLILQGGAWGTFGGCFVGLLLEKKRLRVLEWAACIATVYVSGFIFYQIVVNLCGFDINPPRSNLSIGYTGGVIGLFTWLYFNKKPYGFKGALFGYLGFGLGMAGGRLIGNFVNAVGLNMNHWNVMEVLCGFIGGFVYTFGMLGKRFPEPPEDEKSYKLLNIYSIFYVTAFIPLGHRLTRIRPEKKLDEWTKSLQGFGYDDPAALSQTLLTSINWVCVLGFVAAGIWLVLYLKNRDRWAAFPVLALSLIMLLIQNLNALYFHYPPSTQDVNMHNVFWLFFGLMLAYVAFARGRPNAVTEPDEVAESVKWPRWVASAIVIYLLIVVLAGFTNGERTMQSGNMRFPPWSWSDGTSPPR